MKESNTRTAAARYAAKLSAILFAALLPMWGAAEEKIAYRETAQERANRAVVEGWSTLLFSGKIDEAFSKYISNDYVEHSHLVQMLAKKDKAGYAETLTFFKGMMGGGDRGGGADRGSGGDRGGDRDTGANRSGGAPQGAPNIGQMRINDEMVTQYGPEGADIFRVVNGKITDHWDASPMEAVSLQGENNIGGNGPPRGGGRP